MGINTCQWRASIGCWSGRILKHSISSSTFEYRYLRLWRFEAPLMWFIMLIIAVLLIIGGIEQNPGPLECFHYPDAQKCEEYERRAGTADMTGELFEVDVAALLFLRGMFETDGFHLATNVNQAGGFDDLVFRFKDKDTGLERTCFLQLKTKLKKSITQQALTATSGDFSLLKYYASYCDIHKAFSSQVRSVPFGGFFDSCEFIIYTNTKLDCEHSWYEVPFVGIPDNILYSGKGKIFCLKSGSEERNAFTILDAYIKELQNVSKVNLTVNDIKQKLKKFENITECKKLLAKEEDEFINLLNDQLTGLGDRNMWEQYLNKLKVYTCQAIEEDLEDVVKKDIQTYFGTSETRTTEIFIKLKEGVTEWWRKGNYCLTECFAPFWNTIMKNQISQLTGSLNKKMAGLAVLRFKDTQDILLTGMGQVTYIVTAGTTLLSCLKVQQQLANVGHLMVESSTLQAHLKEVLALWGRGKWCDVLVVVGVAGIQDAIKEFEKVLSLHPYKKLIVVGGKMDQVATQLNEEFKNAAYHENFRFSQLDHVSQQRLLECKVTFQGSSISLKSIADCIVLEDALTADIVVELLTGNMEIGQQLPIQDNSYILRSFLRSEYIDKHILIAEESKTQFAVSGISEEKLQKLIPPGKSIMKLGKDSEAEYKNCQYFIIENDADFIRLGELFDDVHWLHKELDGFVWKESKGDINVIRRYLAEMADPIRYDKVEDILNLPGQMVTVVAKPGMGKSTELSHIASEVKQINLSTWVIRVKLSEHTDYLSQYETNAVDLLLRAGNLGNKFQRALFEYELTKGGNVVVMLDGFDEISPNYVDRVLKLVKELRATKIKKLWITSRPIVSEKLVLELSSLPFVLEPFSRADQIKFFLNFWGDIVSHYDLNVFITKLLELTVKSLNDHQHTFIGNPLQTKMLADAFHAEAKHYGETGEINLPQKLDLLQLYNRFVERKWEIYFEKNPKVYQDAKASFQDNLMYCAIVSLLEDGEIKSLKDSDIILNKYEQFKSRFISGYEKVGIVVDIVRNKPIFLHRTFSEYFFATWLSANLDSIKEFLRTKMFNPNFQIIKNFFDRILAEGSCLHTAVLNCDKVLVEALLKEKTNINARDKAGRTALHLAIMNCSNTAAVSKHQTNLLFGHVCDTEFRSCGWNSDDDGEKEDDKCNDNKKKLEFVEGRNVSTNRPTDSTNDGVDIHDDGEKADDKCNDNKKKLEFVEGRNISTNTDGTNDGVDIDVDDNDNDDDDDDDDGEEEEKEEIVIREHREEYSFDQISPSVEEQIILILLQHGADTTIEDKVFCWRPLRFAGRIRAWTAIGLLLEHQADSSDLTFTRQNMYGVTNKVLLSAAAQGFLHLLEFFFKYGLKVNETIKVDSHFWAYDRSIDFCFYTSLVHVAATCGHLEVVQLLLDHNANIQGQDTAYRRTPLMWAAAHGKLKIVEYLLQQGAQMEAVDSYGNTALLLATRGGHLDIFKLLLQNGADVKTCDIFGNNILHCAAESGNVEFVAHLLDEEFKIDCCNNADQTPLWFAAKNGHLQVTQLLCECGADLCLPKYECASALHVAVSGNHIEVVQYLAKNCVNLDVCDEEKRTPLHIGALEGNLKVVHSLVENGGNVNAHDEEGCTPLHIAVSKGYLKIVQYLIDNCANVNVNDKQRRTPLHVAASRDYWKIVRCLVQNGADLNIHDVERNTPLHIATLNGRLGIVRYLVKSSAQINACNVTGSTPLHVASRMGHLEIVKYLVRHGANVAAQNYNSKTPLDVAEEHFKLDVVEYLKVLSGQILCLFN